MELSGTIKNTYSYFTTKKVALIDADSRMAITEKHYCCGG